MVPDLKKVSSCPGAAGQLTGTGTIKILPELSSSGRRQIYLGVKRKVRNFVIEKFEGGGGRAGRVGRLLSWSWHVKSEELQLQRARIYRGIPAFS